MKQFLLLGCVFVSFCGSVLAHSRGWDGVRNSNENNLYDQNRDRMWQKYGYPNYFYGAYYDGYYYNDPIQCDYQYYNNSTYDPYFYGDQIYYP